MEIKDLENNKSHFKSRIKYHIIFSTKFRKKILNEIEDSVYETFKLSEDINKFIIKTMKVDKDHIHFLVEAKPTIAPGDIVHIMKQCSTYYLYKNNYNYLKRFYWNNNILWTHGYFIASIGTISEDVVFNYIKNQGSDYYNIK